MKKLIVIDDGSEADRICALLERNGIPINRTQASAWSRATPSRPYYSTISVCLDSQFEDARILLRDPSHIPAESVDVQQYHEYVSKDDGGQVAKYLVVRLLLVLAIAVTLAAIAYNFR